MRSARYFAMVLVAIGLTACEGSGTLGPAQDAGDVDPLAALLEDAAERATGDPAEGATGSAGRRHGGGGGSLFDRLAAEIPGFGGLYRTQPCAVAVVLTDMSEAAHAIRVVKTAVEPLVRRACPQGIRVHPVLGKYTYVELHRYLAASRELLQLRGVVGAWIDYSQNAVVIAVTSRAVAETVLEALPRVGIPEDAVAFKLVGDRSRQSESEGDTRSRG